MEVKEIKIKFKWGYIAGKWWGSKDVRPIVLLHGWQENAGTFDRLVPMLSNKFSYLAIDFFGHGLSSHLPFYSFTSLVYYLNIIRAKFKWECISLLGHSMGAIIAFTYAGLFPNNIDLLICIDGMLPIVRLADLCVDLLAFKCEILLETDQQDDIEPTIEPPSHTYAGLIERLVKGSDGIITAESAPYILQRGAKQSAFYPKKYYFTRDRRVRYMHEDHYNDDVYMEMAKRNTVPYLFIKCTNDYFDLNANIWKIVELLRKNNKYFEIHEVSGNHHVHLNNPEKIADTISTFLLKYRLKKINKLDIVECKL